MRMQHLTNEKLIDYLHRELSPSEDAAVLAHLDACESCKRELNAEAAIAERLRADARADERELPLGLAAAIIARINESTPTPLEQLRAFLRPVVLVPLAGLIALAVIFPLTHMGSTVAPGLPVTFYLEEHAAHAQENPLADRSSAVMMTSLEQTSSTNSVPLVQAYTAASIAEDGAR